MDGRLYQSVVTVEKREAQVPVEKNVQKTDERFDETVEGRADRAGQRGTVESDRVDRHGGARQGRDRTSVQVE